MHAPSLFFFHRATHPPSLTRTHSLTLLLLRTFAITAPPSLPTLRFSTKIKNGAVAAWCGGPARRLLRRRSGAFLPLLLGLGTALLLLLMALLLLAFLAIYLRR